MRFTVIVETAIWLMALLSSQATAMAGEGDGVLSLEIAHVAESWTVWEGETFGGPEPAKGIVNDDWAEGAAGVICRLNYVGLASDIRAEYGEVRGQFTKLGSGRRRRFSIDFGGRGFGEMAHGMVVGARYYSIAFENPTSTLGNHEYSELTAGYTFTLNPAGPGINANFRLLSSAPVYWTFMALLAKDRASQISVDNIPISAEMELEVGYRPRGIPINISMGYRLLYFTGWMREGDSGVEHNGEKVGDIIHGAFLKGALDISFVSR